MQRRAYDQLQRDRAERREHRFVGVYPAGEARGGVSERSRLGARTDQAARRVGGTNILPVHSEAELISNLRKKLEELNDYTFSESEWEQFFTGCIAGKNDGIVEKTRRIQEDYVQVLHRDNGATKNITLIDKKNIYNNRLQVINQYENHDGKYENRYDVTILVNGLPLVHIELKRRGVPIREAFNQIDRYQRDSFWASSGLYEYVQIFVISNGTNTKYYSNTTRFNHIKDTATRNKEGQNEQQL